MTANNRFERDAPPSGFAVWFRGRPSTSEINTVHIICRLLLVLTAFIAGQTLAIDKMLAEIAAFLKVRSGDRT